MASGLQATGYGALPDLLAAMRAGPNRGPFVMQADVSNSDNATAQTIEQMCLLIKESINDPLTQNAALHAVSTWGRGSTDPYSIAWACWWTAKYLIRFKLDQPAVSKMLGLHQSLEFLASPAVMLRVRKREGDCDDFTMMICALLGCCGLGWEIITVAANPRSPREFSHVFCRAILPDGSRTLDASHGKYPGWQVPSARVSRIQAWDEDGNPVQDQGANNWDGLHGYEYRGLGDDTTDTGVDDLTSELATLDQSIENSFGPNASLSFLEPLNTGNISSPGGFGPIGSPVGCASGYVVADGSGNCVAASSAQGQAAASSFSANPLAQLLAGIVSSGSSVANSALNRAPAGTINVNTSSLLLYGGIAAAVILVLSLAGRK